MSAAATIGVLALQGAFIEHVKLLKQASKEVVLKANRKWEFLEVRNPRELGRCDALIIPGGESTTIALAAARSGLLEPLREFVKYFSCIMSFLVPWMTDRFLLQESVESQHGEPVQA